MNSGILQPGSTLGVFGGGQIGRMWLKAAHQMGYKTVVFDPDPLSPAGMIAYEHIQANYTDQAALERFVKLCDAVTTEFENIPAETFEYVENRLPVSPNTEALRIAQDRISEKKFLCESNHSVVPYVALSRSDNIDLMLQNFNFPAILKTARFGYDGKGQAIVGDIAEVKSAIKKIDADNYVIEKKIGLVAELSVIVARASSGQTVTYAPSQNEHKNGILHMSIMPAMIDQSICIQATEIAQSIAKQMNYVGVLAVEFFVDSNNALFVNELAPRPHNSGHQTIDACITSQFEQQVRAMCGIHLGDPAMLSPVVLVNLLGDLWQSGEPDWDIVLKDPQVKLHLYNKIKAVKGRKMGHFCVLNADIQVALQLAQRIYTRLAEK